MISRYSIILLTSMLSVFGATCCMDKSDAGEASKKFIVIDVVRKGSARQRIVIPVASECVLRPIPVRPASVAPVQPESGMRSRPLRTFEQIQQDAMSERVPRRWPTISENMNTRPALTKEHADKIIELLNARFSTRVPVVKKARQTLIHE